MNLPISSTCAIVQRQRLLYKLMRVFGRADSHRLEVCERVIAPVKFGSTLLATTALRRPDACYAARRQRSRDPTWEAAFGR